MREHYRLPTVDDTLDKFSDCRVFSKLDVRNAYWHIELDEESSLLTTMITPFGRYRWCRLPFGLPVSGEIFQRRLTEALAGLEGVICVADDIAILSKDDATHDSQLEALLRRCDELGIKLNSSPDKLRIKCKEMTLHGHVFTIDGVKPDPSKVQSLLDMPAPDDVPGVLRFCGLAQYLSRFLPHLAEAASPLRALTCKDAEWNWTPVHQDAFYKIKKMACEVPLLSHYNPSEELTLQTDASSHGLGATLLQNGTPIAYASRALTRTECNYAQIEKECLSIVFGLERFDQYTFGRPVMAENDHKPLEVLMKKPLHAIPKRLQAMRMRIAQYDIDLRYKPGPSMVLPDTLSRAHPEFSDAGSDKHGLFDCVNALVFMPLTDKRIEELRTATAADDMMQQLTSVIKQGWPESKEQLPKQLIPYFDVRDTLTIQDGIVLKGEHLVIPPSMRHDIKQRLHASHLGKDSMLRRAREVIYWPGLTYDVQQLAESCDICQSLSPRQRKETLTPHPRSDTTWQKIGLDLFSIHGRDYLVSVDYLSNFWEVDYLPTTSTSMILTKLKTHLARYGIPLVIVSDNAQFVSEEFQTFTDEYGIGHLTSSPGHSQSNGKAESAVKAAKRLISV